MRINDASRPAPTPIRRDPPKPAAAPKEQMNSVVRALKTDSFTPALKEVAKTRDTAATTGGGLDQTKIIDGLKAGDASPEFRKGVGDYFRGQDMAGCKATMDAIRKEGLLGNFLDATVRDENGNPPGAELKAALTTLMETGKVDVYAETLATATISVGAYDGLFYDPGKKGVFLDEKGLGDTQNLANILAHELFHGFNDEHGGSTGAVNEGFGIAAREYAFKPDGEQYNVAEMVYGTKNYYRDIENQPDYPLGDATNADPKLREFMTALASRDSSQIAWNDPAKLQDEYQKFFEPVNRNQDWDTWLKDVDHATTDMLEARKVATPEPAPAPPAETPPPTGTEPPPTGAEPPPAAATPTPAPPPANPVQQFVDALRDFFKRLFGG